MSLTTRQKWAGAACCFVAALSTPPAHAATPRPTRMQIATRISTVELADVKRRGGHLDVVLCYPTDPPKANRPRQMFCLLFIRPGEDDLGAWHTVSVTWQADLHRPGNRIRRLAGWTRVYRPGKPAAQFRVVVVPNPVDPDEASS